MENTTEFTLRDAFNYQARDLNEWDSILNDKSSILLYKEVLKRNLDVTDPYKVFRGSEMTYFIRQLAMENTK